MILFAAWLTADFLSGLVHWIEDRYGDPEWPIAGPLVVAPNIKHHTDQMAFTVGGYWERNWTTIVPAAIVAGVAAACGWWFVAAAFAFLSQANEVHSWAHQRCTRQIRGLQLLGILQSPDQHAQHHKRPFDRNYCVMTDILNPILSAARFWEAAEFVVYQVSGVRPRPERSEA
jgi:ubiquitin-conjugating enzyme E2 variant